MVLTVLQIALAIVNNVYMCTCNCLNYHSRCTPVCVPGLYLVGHSSQTATNCSVKQILCIKGRGGGGGSIRMYNIIFEYIHAHVNERCRRKEETSKQSQTNKAKQYSTPKAITCPKEK